MKKALGKSKIDPAAITFIYSVVLCALRIFIIISAIAQLGVNVAALLTAIGAATVTIGLALQDTMKNVASGVMIIINKPFKAGEYIQFEGLEGTVDKIMITNTYLITIDNKEVIIPNSRLTNNNLINYTSQDMRRIDLVFKIDYSNDIKLAKKVLSDIAESEDRILKSPEPIVGVLEQGNSSIGIAFRVWCKTEEYWNVYFDLQEQTKIEFDKNGITIPFEQIDVHLKKD
ncbi:mechanosensitive ion channel [Ruminococcus sp. zg-924]|nr:MULTISPECIES: mechanosensitive ion channel domain-containing protein [unclassified Ruminococcus]MCQ4022624.1 mechanosensitive ion channel [Ruminococcus sp. zg-924]MCQ4114864.1 mechanosensitive ion channel [Ruminococcus sp. zg-921]